MDWDLLHERFVAASRPEPPPCEGDAIEWDYSRVSRALGLAGDQALADRPWDGLSLVSARALWWDEAAGRYGEWAREAGWRFVRVSAAPLADVPDPIPLAISREIVPDGLFLAGALRARVPVTGRRPRSPGASTPFRPGERWMIGLDRVRRRCRIEAANDGLVLFVDAAHHVSPASLNLLVYLLNVHRGWRGRMLAAPGKCYVVMAVPPEQEPVLTERLERFGIDNGYAFVEETGGAGAAAPAAPLDVESEHLLAALADAPMALTAADVGALFGRSALAGLDGLVERGLVAVERGGPSPAFRVAPNAAADLPEPPPRVRRAIIERYRRRARRGHEHVLLGAALLALRMGDLRRAIVLVGRSSQGDAPALSSHLFGELAAGLDAAVDRMRASDVAALLALYAHQRRYDRCRHLARAITERPFRSETDLLRTLVHVLCVGRAHLDHALPDGFWSDLKPGRLDPSVLDAAAILGELFARLRWMNESEVMQRYEIAARSLACAMSRECGPTARLQAALALLLLRVETVLCFIFRSPDETVIDFGLPRDSQRLARIAMLPALWLAATAHQEVGLRHTLYDSIAPTEPRLPEVLERAAACGHTDERVVALAAVAQLLAQRRVGLIATSVVDDIVITSFRIRASQFAQQLRLILHGVVLDREWLISARSLLFPRDVRTQSPRGVLERVALALYLASCGELRAAREALRTVAGELPAADSRVTACFFQSVAYVAHASLSPQWASEIESVSMASRRALPPLLQRVLDAYADGLAAFYEGDYSEAVSALDSAVRSLGRSAQDSIRTVARLAVRSRELAKTVASVTAELTWDAAGTGGRNVGASVVRKVRRVFAKCGLVTATNGRFARPDAFLRVVEEFARAGYLVQSNAALGVALEFRRCTETTLRELGDSCMGACARLAPNFYARVRAALEEQTGGMLELDDTPGSVDAALGIVERYERGIGRLVPPQPPSNWLTARSAAALVDVWSRRRIAVHAYRKWVDDAALLRRLCATCSELPSDATLGTMAVRMYGVVERGAVAEHVVRRTVQVEWRRISGTTGVTRVTICDAGSEATERTRVRASTRDASEIGRSDQRGFEREACNKWQIEGSSDTAEQLRKHIQVASRCDYPVLIIGETGTGKEHVARQIHAASRRSNAEFCVADCGTASDGLLESELFGHVRGAFTGAVQDREGIFARAHHGTLFLDELDSMSWRMQTMLLRVLETGEYRPVGSDRSRVSEFRLIAAASSQLMWMVGEGRFRQDLLYRVSTLKIVVPPLRERGQDGIEIARRHVGERGRELGRDAEEWIAGYSWPGNVRELLHCLDAAMVLAPDGPITAGTLAEVIGGRASQRHGGRSPQRSGRAEAAWAVASAALATRQAFGAWEFASVAGISRRSAQRYLALLAGQGVVTRLGAGKATQYRIGRQGA